MKSKLSWIPFIPVVFAAVFLRIYQVLFIDSGVDKGFLDSGLVSIIFVGSIVALFVILAIFCFADKKTAPEYDIGRNIFAGFFAILTGALLLTDAVLLVMQMISAGLFDWISGIDVLLSLAGGAMIFVMGISSLTGYNRAKHMPFLMLLPTVWCCGRLVLTFASYTAISPAAKDMSDLVYMVFATLFLFNVSMVYIKLKGKNPVKACFLYGLPAVVVIFAYAGALFASLIQSGQGVDFFANIRVFEFLSFALYILFFLLELTAGAKGKQKEDALAVDTAPQKEQQLHVSHENARQSLKSGQAADPETARAEAIMAKVEEADRKKNDLVDYVGYYNRDVQDQTKKDDGLSDYASKLDDIDRLILELSENDHKE